MRYKYFVNEKNRTVACKFDRVGKHGEKTDTDNFYNAIKELALSQTSNKHDMEIMNSILDSDLAIRTVFSGDIPVGVAKCLPEDTFDIQTGKDLAKQKLDRKLRKTSLRLLGSFDDVIPKAIIRLYQNGL